jgi:hypothetical protein
MCDKYFAHCSDRGVEMDVTGRSISLPEYFPYWRDIGISDGADEHLEDDHLDPSSSVGLRKTLDVPGTYHAIDNIQKRVLDALPHWGEMKSIIEGLCQAFHYQYIRDAFISECLGPYRGSCESIFKSGPPLFEGGRVWNVLLVISEWFLDREQILRNRWSLDKMLFKKLADNANAGENKGMVSKRLRVCDGGIKSYFTWAYFSVLKCFGKFLREIIIWCASCSCHPYDFALEFNLVADQYSCPMRGRRAAEIACGELHEFVETRLQLQFRNLLGALRGLTTQQRRIILDVFEIGKAIILDEFAVRFAC